MANLKKRVIAAIVGQSNELGSGYVTDFTSAYGYPLRDPVKPNGGTTRSMWPYLSDLMGRSGIWFNVWNAAVGGTSLPVCWVGQIRAYASSALVGLGQYVVQNGNLYKATAATFSGNTTLGQTAATPPTWPSSGTVADSTVTWTYVRAATAADVTGKMFKEGDAEFDPNGYIANAYSGLASAIGYDEKWMLLSIGQGDKTLASTAADFKNAYINVTQYFLNRSVKCALGFTCAGNSNSPTNQNLYYDTYLEPGYLQALASFAGNLNVVAGANLYRALGALPDVAVGTTTPGIKDTDHVHMNDAAYALASEAWRDALFAAKWV